DIVQARRTAERTGGHRRFAARDRKGAGCGIAANAARNRRLTKVGGSAVDRLVGVAQHLAAIGAQIGEVALRQAGDLVGETVVLAALFDAVVGVGDKVAY